MADIKTKLGVSVGVVGSGPVSSTPTLSIVGTSPEGNEQQHTYVHIPQLPLMHHSMPCTLGVN